MKDTSCGENCPFVKCGVCETEKGCPNYCETWWIPGGEEQPVMLKDCSPKRMMMQQQVLQAKLENVQKSLEIARDEYNALSMYFKGIVQSCQKILSDKTKEKQNESALIDYDSDDVL